MTIDVTISNPPYQEESEGDSTFLKPIYHNFMLKALRISTKSVFITPSRWMQGGKGLEEFRFEMMNSNKFKYITDYQDSSTIFPNIWLDGGISYSLIDNKYQGKVEYTYINKNNKQFKCIRYLNEGKFEYIIRDRRQLQIIEKVQKLNENTFDSIVSKRDPFGFNTGLFNHPENYKSADLRENIQESNQEKEKGNYIKIYGVRGEKDAVRVYGYVKRESITENIENINKYNIFFSYAYNIKSTTPPKQILSIPSEVCTGTFLSIGPFNIVEEQTNCHKYMQTKFFKALLFFHRFQKNCTYKTFELIPIQDFTKEYTDKELYEKYKLNQEDIEYIEELIK